MANDPHDCELLEREHLTIEHLSVETNTAIATVRELYLAEYKKLGAHAHIKSFLPLLTCNSVRRILDLENAKNR